MRERQPVLAAFFSLDHEVIHFLREVLMRDEYCDGVYLETFKEISFYLDEEIGMEGAGRAKGIIEIRRAFSSLSIRYMSNAVVDYVVVSFIR